MSSFGVEVENLGEFRRGLRRIETGLGKELGKANKDVGAEIVKLVDRRRRQLSGRYGSYRSKKVRVRPSASQRNVTITVRPGAAEMGARRHPVYGRWLDQARFDRRVWPPQLKGGQGHLVRPTITEHVDDVAEIYVERIGRFARDVIGG